MRKNMRELKRTFHLSHVAYTHFFGHVWIRCTYTHIAASQLHCSIAALCSYYPLIGHNMNLGAAAVAAVFGTCIRDTISSSYTTQRDTKKVDPLRLHVEDKFNGEIIFELWTCFVGDCKLFVSSSALR